MEWILRSVGEAQVLAALNDEYLTVLYPGGSGPLRGPLKKGD